MYDFSYVSVYFLEIANLLRQILQNTCRLCIFCHLRRKNVGRFRCLLTCSQPFVFYARMCGETQKDLRQHDMGTWVGGFFNLT
jgi:hypothetical protein